MASASILRGREWWVWKQRRCGRDDKGSVRLRTVYPERILVGRPGHELPYLPCRFRMTDEQMAEALEALPGDDPETAHMFADALLVSFLRGCGYKRAARAYTRLKSITRNPPNRGPERGRSHD